MGAGASTPPHTPLGSPRKGKRKEGGDEDPAPGSGAKYKLNFHKGQMRQILNQADKMLANPKTSNDDFFKAITEFNLDSVTGYKSPKGAAKLIAVSIFHRHGSRGPGESEIRPWTDAKHPVVKQWNPKELEQLTANGNIQLRSLGRWFAEKYLMSRDDAMNSRHADPAYQDYPESKIPYDNLSNKATVWRASSSGRAYTSGSDFTQAINKIYNHPLQLKPVRNLVPKDANRHEDVEGENRKDDHGMDHYFRPWNVHKTQMNEIKNGISANLLWVEKADKHLDFLKSIFRDLGCEKSLQRNPTKMLWCCSYIVCLYECERFWTSDPQIIAVAGQRDALRSIIDGNPGYLEEVTHLACWVWNQRFVYQPHLLRLGGRVTFDMLQQLLHWEKGGVSVFSGHDYTMVNILSVLQVLQKRGGLEKPIEFGAYVAFELWTRPPPAHHSDPVYNTGTASDNCGEEPQQASPVAVSVPVEVAETAYCNGVHHRLQKLQAQTKTQTQTQTAATAGGGDQGDQRVLRVVWNDAPFDPADQEIIREIQNKNSRSRDKKLQELFLYSWPVREEREKKVIEIDMYELRTLMDNLHRGLLALEVEPYLDGDESYAEFKRELLYLPVKKK